jgi:hypothetical protein
LSSRTIVTFADLYRESPGVVTSTESSFVVLLDDCELRWLFHLFSLFCTNSFSATEDQHWCGVDF